MIADPSGNYLYVLDHDSPDNCNRGSCDRWRCRPDGVTTCGDITAFRSTQTTGRLSLIVECIR